jgi:hypothetical protein
MVNVGILGILVLIVVVAIAGIGIRMLGGFFGAFANRGQATLTCPHCHQETPAGPPTCEHCGCDL